MSCHSSSITLQGLLVHCLLVLFFWYCAARFASRAQLGSGLCLARLVSADSRVVQEIVAEGVGREVHWISGFGPGRKTIRLNRKPPAHLAGLVVQSRPRVWKRLCLLIHLFPFLIARGGETIRMMGDMLLLRSGSGWVNFQG